MQHQHHHPHVRKRSARLQPYPSSIFTIAILDVVVYIVSIASPIFTIPQVVDIFVGKDASGVSALSWGAYTLFTVPWLAYGIVHKEKVLIFNNTLWLFLNAVIFIGALVY